MRNILKPAFLALGLGPLAACSTPTTEPGVRHEPASSSNGCVGRFSANVVFASVSHTGYNRDCAERAMRTDMINSSDPGVAAVGLRSSELAGDIPSQAIDEVVGQIHNPKSQACTVTGKSGNKAQLSCAAPVLVTGQ